MTSDDLFGQPAKAASLAAPDLRKQAKEAAERQRIQATKTI
jgi:hypothetical protein